MMMVSLVLARNPPLTKPALRIRTERPDDQKLPHHFLPVASRSFLLRLSGMAVAVLLQKTRSPSPTPPGGHYSRNVENQEGRFIAGLHCQTGHCTEKRLSQHSSYSEDGRANLNRYIYHNYERAAISVSVGTSMSAHLLGL